MTYIFHIAMATEWHKAKLSGSYTADTLASEGFIHCSKSDQLIRVANFLFRGRTDLVLLCVDRSKVKAEIRDENLEGGDDQFPHIYGPLNLDAVTKVFDFVPELDGCFAFSEEMRLAASGE